MTAAAVHDALAAWLGELAAIQVVYGDGSTNSAVKPMPAKVVAMPAVLVRRGATERHANTSRETYRREWEADFYLPTVGVGDTTRDINTIDDQLLVKMRRNIHLDGTVSFIRYLGMNPPQSVEEGEGEGTTQYIVVTARFETEERVGVTYSVDR